MNARRPNGSPDAERVTDAGLAIERTTLAWTRSGLALIITGAFTVKTGVGTALEPLGYIAGALIVLAGGAVWGYAESRYQLGRAALAGVAPAAVPVALRWLARATLACAVAAMGFVVLSA